MVEVGTPAAERLSPDELTDAWPILTEEERLEGLRLLPVPEADDFFRGITARDQAALVLAIRPGERLRWLRILDPDDTADLIQEAPPEQREGLIRLLDAVSAREVRALLAYAEDEAGGLMSPRFARMRPEMSTDEAIAYLRRQARTRVETIYYAYVLDAEQRLLGVISFRDLFTAQADRRVEEIMQTDLVTVSEHMDQESVSLTLAEWDLLAVPVIGDDGRMKGIVTVDDIVDVVQEEATEDIQKAGGMAALDAPYLDTEFGVLIRKRVGWLVVLFLGGLLTATAMEHYDALIRRAVVLSAFIPLIISSGGNSGSQASTLVIRAMALGEVRLRDWWRVMRRELGSGLLLGAILGVVGLLRVLVWEQLFGDYGSATLDVALTVAFSLVAIVLVGTVVGSMLPLLLRRFGMDPASASAPFVATVVDVSGLVIYFTFASWILSGSLL